MFCIFMIISLVGFTKEDGIPMQDPAGTEFSSNSFFATPEPESEPSFCKPFFETEPNFDQPGRRISEARCHSYIWNLNVRLEKSRLNELCNQYHTQKKICTELGGRPTKPGEYPHMDPAGTEFSSYNFDAVPEPKPVLSFCKQFFEPESNFEKPGRRIREARSEYLGDGDRGGAGLLGGGSTKLEEYTHMGAIGWKASVGTEWVFKCGGSLISEKFILTAAHCSRASPLDTTISDPIPKIVRFSNKINFRNDFSTNAIRPTQRKIYKIIVHPQYSSPKKYFDIALMELDEEIEFSSMLNPACLWGRSSTSELGTEATLTGWGVVELGSVHNSPKLLKAKVDVFDSQTCDELLKNSRNRNWWGMKDHQICAGKLAGGVDACQGDSGGPLQVQIPLRSNLEGQMHYVVGVISFGVGCGYSNLPGLYTRVSSFIDWIEDIVWGNKEEIISWGSQI